MNEVDLLRDCVRRLNIGGISYMLTGSMASNVWGLPRSTHDLDFVIQLPPSQVPNLISTFASADYHLDELSVRAAYRPPHQFNAIHIPSALKADFWLLRPDPFEREMFSRRIKDNWMGETIWLATPEDLILHKLYWNQMTPSERQLGDVVGIVTVQRTRLDESYLRHWAANLNVLPVLEAALSGKLKPKHT